MPSVSRTLGSQEFAIGIAAGVATCIAAAALYERLFGKKKEPTVLHAVGSGNKLSRSSASFRNPHYGLSHVRSDEVRPDAAAPPPQVLEEPAKVSEDFLKKHPKGLGVEPRQVKGREVTEVLLLPVSHLGDFYQSKNAENRLGSGANKDYNQFTQSEDVILGDIVRKASSGGVSRAYLRAGPRKMLYFQPTEVRAAIVTCGGLCPGLNNIIRDVTKSLLDLYGVKEVWGVRGGYWGFHKSSESDANLKPVRLTHQAVSGIQHVGGTMLGSARGGYDLEEMLGFCGTQLRGRGHHSVFFLCPLHPSGEKMSHLRVPTSRAI